MSRKPLTFKQRDITRAIRAVTASGAKVGRIKIETDGTINVFVGDQAANLPDDDREFAEWRAGHGYQ